MAVGTPTPRDVRPKTNKKNGARPVWDWTFDNDDLTEKEMHHGVNLAQAVKLGAVWHRVSGAPSDLRNTAVALDRLDRRAGPRNLRGRGPTQLWPAYGVMAWTGSRARPAARTCPTSS